MWFWGLDRKNELPKATELARKVGASDLETSPLCLVCFWAMPHCSTSGLQVLYYGCSASGLILLRTENLNINTPNRVVYRKILKEQVQTLLTCSFQLIRIEEKKTKRENKTIQDYRSEHAFIAPPAKFFFKHLQSTECAQYFLFLRLLYWNDILFA